VDIYERIFESTPDALLVIGREGEILRTNRQAEQMFGYARDEFLRVCVEQLIPERFASRHRQHRAAYAEEPRTRSMGEGLELLGLRKDGTEFPVDIMLSPMDNNGDFRVLCVVRDVTERKHAEEKFRSLLESAPDAMVITNARGEIVLVNSQTEWLFGYDRQELLGKTVEILVPDEFRAVHPKHRAAYFSAPRTRAMGEGIELNGRRKDGVEFPVEISLSPIRTAEGTLVSAAVRDISERRLANQMLRESLREKEVLLKEIHHRVKNNLAVISSMFYLQSTYTDHEPLLQMLQASQYRVRSMALVHESLYQSDNLAAVNFFEYATALSRQLMSSIGPSAAGVQLSTETESVEMRIDVAVPCGLILNELLTNALKHAFPGERHGKIEVGLTRENGEHCVLRVRDNGVGIPQKTVIDECQSMGFRLIRSLARQIDGSFEFVSQSQGTEARLRIPVA